MNGEAKEFYCRLCAELQYDHDLIKVTDPTSNDSKLSIKISECFFVNIVEEDTLPQHVCHSCCNKVNYTFEFLEQIRKSQHLLQQKALEVKHEIENTEIDDEDAFDNLADNFYEDTKQGKNFYDAI